MARAVVPKEIIIYADEAGIEPYSDWLGTLKDKQRFTGRNIKTMRKYRTLSDVTEEYYLENPEEIEGFLKITFEEYAKDNDAGALLSALRIISRVKGISKMADEIGITRKGLQKALSVNGNPRLENINSIMQALGYRLSAEKLHSSHLTH